MSSKVVIRTLLAGLVAGLAAAPAFAASLPAEFQAKLLVRVLPYDKTLAERTKSMRVGVLYAPGNADSEAAATALVAQIGKVAPGKRIQGEKLEAGKVPFGGKADLEARHKADPFACFFIAPGLGPQTAQIVQIARARGILTVGSVRQNVKAGAAVALVAEGDNPKIVVNVSGAQATGATFSSAFLSLAEIM
jgi:hypothetical protein